MEWFLIWERGIFSFKEMPVPSLETFPAGGEGACGMFGEFMKKMILVGVIFLSLVTVACAGSKGVKNSYVKTREVQFSFDSFRLVKKVQDELDDYVIYLKENPDVVLLLEGHTDPIGHQVYNMDLGDKRARSVKAYFIAKGIDGDRLITLSQGESKIKYHYSKKNRRVWIGDPRLVSNEIKNKNKN